MFGHFLQTLLPSETAGQEKKDKNMSNKLQAMKLDFNLNVDHAPALDPVKDQRRFLEGRLEEAYLAKREELRKQFNMIDDPAPKNPDELIERLASGRFVKLQKPDGAGDSWFRYHSVRGDWFQWRDPAAKADRPGYDAAKAALKAKRETVREDIRVLDPKDALAAVRAFAS